MLDRHECFSVFHHLQKNKKCKQRHSLKLGKKRRESFKRNYYIISPRVIIKAIIISLLDTDANFEGLNYFQKRRKRHCNAVWTLITSVLIKTAFITGNSSLEPLFEALFAQIHVNLSWRDFGRNRTGDLRITRFVESRALHHWAKVTDETPKIPQDPLYWTWKRKKFVLSLDSWDLWHETQSDMKRERQQAGCVCGRRLLSGHC